jgi:hypothetical protein
MADSPLWTNPASSQDLFTSLQVSQEEIDKVAREMRNNPEVQQQLKERTKAYRAPVPARILQARLD